MGCLLEFLWFMCVSYVVEIAAAVRRLLGGERADAPSGDSTRGLWALLPFLVGALLLVVLPICADAVRGPLRTALPLLAVGLMTAGPVAGYLIANRRAR